MKVKLLQENFAKALSITSRFSSSKAQLPVLGNTLLSARKTKFLLASTNLEISVVVKLAGKIEEEGEITVPSKVITEIVNNLTPGGINIASEKEQLSLQKDGFSSTLLGMNSSDYPKVPEVVGSDNVIKLTNGEFLKSIPQVVFACSTDETRPVLTGILMLHDKNSILMVATDGFRLSQKRIASSESFEGQINLPRGAILEVAKLFEGQEEILMNFKSKDNQVLFGNEDLVLSSRIIEGNFPDFEKIIPKTTKYKVLVGREELVRAVKISSAIARDAANIIKIKVGKHSLGIFAESPSSGTQETSVEAKVEGVESDNNFEIAFNYKFLEEFLHSTNSSDIRMELSDTDSPGVFLDPTDANYLHLIMPVRIQG